LFEAAAKGDVTKVTTLNDANYQDKVSKVCNIAMLIKVPLPR